MGFVVANLIFLEMFLVKPVQFGFMFYFSESCGMLEICHKEFFDQKKIHYLTRMSSTIPSFPCMLQSNTTRCCLEV